MDCYNKFFECVDEKGMPLKVRKILHPIYVRHISSLQFFNKGCQVYVVHILYPVEGKGWRLEDYKILLDYVDVFPDKVSGLPPKRDIDFTMNLMPWASPVSKVHYRMSTP